MTTGIPYTEVKPDGLRLRKMTYPLDSDIFDASTEALKVLRQATSTTELAMPKQRLNLTLGGDWRQYTDTLPEGCTFIGIALYRNDTQAGALIQKKDGSYWMIGEDFAYPFFERKVEAAIATAKANALSC